MTLTAQQTKDNQIFYKPGAPSTVKLYIDGSLVAEHEYLSPGLSDSPPSTPLLINTALVPTGSRPIISTRMIDDGEIADSVHPELMASCASFLQSAQ